jgi:hypothetical protein
MAEVEAREEDDEGSGHAIGVHGGRDRQPTML